MPPGPVGEERSASFLRYFASTNAAIRKTLLHDVIRPVDIAQIDDHHLRHRFLQSPDIECAELFPFGDNDECGGARIGS